ncbi:hypothetical protein JL722_3140 [Aureococcus anophagefferens]|nr:hypothetical protein JL722_3140 [Aureococcus anophagefferens]
MAPGGHPMHRANATARAAFKASLPTIRDYAESPGIPSCACKMVLGRPCGGAARLTAADAAEAVRRVTEDFLFVGSQDHFRASVALAHAMLAPGLPPDYAKQVETTSARHGYTRADRDAAVANLTGYSGRAAAPARETDAARLERRSAKRARAEARERPKRDAAGARGGSSVWTRTAPGFERRDHCARGAAWIREECKRDAAA